MLTQPMNRPFATVIHNYPPGVHRRTDQLLPAAAADAAEVRAAAVASRPRIAATVSDGAGRPGIERRRRGQLFSSHRMNFENALALPYYLIIIHPS